MKAYKVGAVTDRNVYYLFQVQFLRIIVKFIISFHQLLVLSVKKCLQGCLSNQDFHPKH